jgi:hypothetical protein
MEEPAFPQELTASPQTDIAVAIGHYAEAAKPPTRPIVRFGAPLHVHGDVWIADFGAAAFEPVLRACSGRGLNWDPNYLSFGAYALYRTNAPAGNGNELAFDPDGQLYTCLRLSRLVHPTSIGLDFATRIRKRPDGQVQIIPNRFYSLNPHAFTIVPEEDWLIPADIPRLRALADAFFGRPQSDRIKSALFYYEAAARSYYYDLAWPLLTTGIEALVHIEGELLPNNRFARSTKVFADRLLRIGALDPALNLPEATLREMYRRRSLLVHGQTLGALDATTRSLLRGKLNLLRGILQKAILDPAFATAFSTDAALQAALPLRP